MAEIRPSSCYAGDAPPITDAHVAALEAEDYVVIDGLFPRVDELRQALDDAEYRKTMQSESIRTDRVRWITEEDGVVGDTVRALRASGIHSRRPWAISVLTPPRAAWWRATRAAATAHIWTTIHLPTTTSTGSGRVRGSSRGAS